MKTLELRFVNESGKTSALRVESPLEPVNPAQVAAAMGAILLSDVFTSTGGGFVAKKDARLIDHKVEEIQFN